MSEIHRHDGADATRPRLHDDDAVAEKYRLVDIVVTMMMVTRSFCQIRSNSFCKYARDRVERAERLIEKKNGGLRHQRAGNGSALRHAA